MNFRLFLLKEEKWTKSLAELFIYEFFGARTVYFGRTLNSENSYEVTDGRNRQQACVRQELFLMFQ
jgi:hypothetical protein